MVNPQLLQVQPTSRVSLHLRRIDAYKRRFVGFHKKEPNDRPTRTAEHSPSPVFTNAFKAHQNAVRNAREEEEVRGYLKKYTKEKIYFYKNLAKSYYKNEF